MRMYWALFLLSMTLLLVVGAITIAAPDHSSRGDAFAFAWTMAGLIGGVAAGAIRENARRLDALERRAKENRRAAQVRG